MPYIDRQRRAAFVDHTDALANTIETEGELNFVITRILVGYLVRHTVSYGNINAVMGVLACAQAEFYRQYAASYEDTKKLENGDLFAPVD